MPAGMVISIAVPIFQGMCDISGCCCYGAMKIHKHGMMMVKMLPEKAIAEILANSVIGLYLGQ